MTKPAQVEIGDISYRIQPGDRIRYQISQKKFEFESLRAFDEICSRHKGTFIDAGGYIGLYSIPAKILGLEVHTFEPYDLPRKQLIENLHLNNFTEADIDIQAVALSNSNEEKTLYTIKNQMTSISSLRRHEVHNHEIKVPTRTLDSYKFQNVTLIKIDVEEHETQVIQGALETIHNSYPFLLIESLNEKETEILLSEVIPEYKIKCRLDERNLLLGMK